MLNRHKTLRSLLLAGACGGLLAAAPALAQQAAAPLPPGSPLIGQPDNDGAKKLAPVAAPPLATAPDKLPLDKLKTAAGFKLEVYASGMAGARSLRLGDKGTVFVSTRLQDKVYAIVDKGGKREVKVVASGLYRPNGIVFYKGTLYIAELSQISKIDNIESVLDNPPKPTVFYTDLPKDEAHGWKYLTVGPDGKLYFQVGAPCNICMPDDQHAQIRRMNPDGTGVEVVARGIRQIVGMDFDPVTKMLYWSENSRDWLSEDIPNDKLNRLSKVGLNFGYPYCHQGNVPDQEFGWGHKCSDFEHPIALLGPHAAALGMRFYTGSQFPADYRNNIILARHGSWNRSIKFGGDVVMIKLGKDRLPADKWDIPGDKRSDIKELVWGFIQNNSYVGRPVDVMQMKDGSMLISDDWNGAVYRLSYGRPQSAAAH
jgi:glucose/arabinose dehydrogenase